MGFVSAGCNCSSSRCTDPSPQGEIQEASWKRETFLEVQGDGGRDRGQMAFQAEAKGLRLWLQDGADSDIALTLEKCWDTPSHGFPFYVKVSFLYKLSSDLWGEKINVLIGLPKRSLSKYDIKILAT